MYKAATFPSYHPTKSSGRLLSRIVTLQYERHLNYIFPKTEKHLDQKGTRGIPSSKNLLLIMKLVKAEDMGSSSSSSKKSFSSDFGVEDVVKS